jgi:hypothetical protein
VSWTDFVLPTYTCRSTDDGKTWETPVKLSDPWCGCIHSLIQMKSGPLVLVGQEIIPQWRHATVMWASDDLGKTWQRGDVLDYGVGEHDHAGSHRRQRHRACRRLACTCCCAPSRASCGKPPREMA